MQCADVAALCDSLLTVFGMQELVDGQPLFPGDSDVDQLYIIQQLLGPITAKQNVAFLKNPRFSGYRFGDDLTYNPAKLDKRYGKQLATGKLSAHALDFMKRCLCMEPAERLSIEDCLQHPYFAGLSEQVEGQARTSTSAHLRTPGAKRPFSQRSSGSVATQDEPRAEAFHAADDVVCSGLVGTPAKRHVRH